MSGGAPSIVIVAGELSGDMHAARLLKAMKEMRPGLEAWGIGGDHLQAEGMKISQHADQMAVMGIWEVLKRYGFFRKVFHGLLAEIRQRKPDLVLLVDYPGFNLRLAAALQGEGIPIVQYVCPQVWAWKKNRIPKMASVLDRLIAIFPFEPAVFKGVNLDVQYCGHPLVDEVAEVDEVDDWPEDRKLLLLPGSREQEIARLLEPMVGAARLLQREDAGISVRIAAGDEKSARLIAAQGLDLDGMEVVVGQTRELLKTATAALVTSGTATLETTLLGCPMVVVYKTSALTYEIGKRVITVPHIGMVNLVAEREVCKEMIQGAASAEALAEAVKPLLEDGPERQAMLKGYEEVRGKLVSDEDGHAPARAILELLKG